MECFSFHSKEEPMNDHGWKVVVDLNTITTADLEAELNRRNRKEVLNETWVRIFGLPWSRPEFLYWLLVQLLSIKAQPHTSLCNSRMQDALLSYEQKYIKEKRRDPISRF